MSVAAIPIEHSIAPRIEVQWHCLDVDDEAAERLTGFLSRGEREQAQRFHYPIDRRRYCVRRGVLRELLAQYLECGPCDVAIAYTRFGKPYVADSDVTFNLSHSRGMALYAFARGPEIGCDVEWQDPRFATCGTAELVLSRAEIESFQLLPERQRTRAFFNYWTCKEAYLKARGAGFALPPQEITVSLVGTPRFVALPEDDPAEWSLAPIDPAPGYIAMLAVHGSAPIIQLRRIQGRNGTSAAPPKRQHFPGQSHF